jgi:glycosyltransferase involved in cell wall biosynthesis
VFDTLKQMQFASDVHFTGHLPEEDLPALYNGASAFVFPSLYEGFGLPVLEAMACGVPVVTSNCSSLPEVAGQAAVLVDPWDVNAIAAAVRRVLEEPDLAACLRAEGLAQSQEFSWERTARETIAVYEKVLGERIRP